jgi:spoIIIJ-associated protein
MIKIESETLENAYSQAAEKLGCSVTQLEVEIVQHPSRGILGLFSKRAIIVAMRKDKPQTETTPVEKRRETVKEERRPRIDESDETEVENEPSTVPQQRILNDTILPESFVTDQDEEDEQNDYIEDAIEGMFDEDEESFDDIDTIAVEVKKQINDLFSKICFELNDIEVSVYDENTLMIDFNGADAALLIGKEGYRYKALSYMIFNWINAKYGLQLRLEIAEFLKNQEESITRYLVGVCEAIDRDGRAQTKILDGVLVQIALKQLREHYPDKYVAIRSTRDGSKFIIVNGYNSY